MKNQGLNTVKLGIFVLAGLILLIVALYALGKNRNLFGSQFELKTRFRDVNGLLIGNNVRFSGIDVGSVRTITILNDTTVEVVMNLDRKMKNFIRINAIASLGTDGLIGNRVINIAPADASAPFVNGGELLPSRGEVNTQQMLQTLSRTNESVAVIAQELLVTVQRINNSAQLTRLLDDESLGNNLRASLVNLNRATANAALLMEHANATLDLASEGRGTLATLLTDTSLTAELRRTVTQLQAVENGARQLAGDLDAMVTNVDHDYRQGGGPVGALLRDSLMTQRLDNTLDNVEKGTAAFNENMEALKHNFLFRGYFKKQEKKKKKAAGKN
ncbi:MAG: MlaD family protein [Saprospiraceae bacterium]